MEDERQALDAEGAVGEHELAEREQRGGLQRRARREEGLAAAEGARERGERREARAQLRLELLL